MIDTIVAVVSLVSALTALYIGLRKQKSEEDNLDADTIKTLYGLIHDLEAKNKADKIEQADCYAKLEKEFRDYKLAMNAQIADVVNENVKLRKWAKKLAAQLEQAGIIPVTYEL